MRLYLAEHRHQVDDFLERGLKGPATWVALGPGAMHSLGRRGIPYTIPEDYLSREEIEAACVGQFEQLSHTCRRLDAAMWERDPFLKKWEIRPFFFHLWQLGQVADLLLSRTLILSKMLTVTGAPEVVVHLGPRKTFGFYGLGFHPRHTIWGHLLALPGWGPKIISLPEPLRPAQPGENSHADNSAWQKLRNFSSLQTRAHPRLFSLVKSWQAGLRGNLTNLLLAGLKGNRQGIAFFNGFYEWSAVLPTLVSQGQPVSFFNSQDLLKNNHLLTNENSDNSEQWWELFRNALQLHPIDFSPILYDRFRYILETASLSAQSIVQRLKEAFHETRVKVMLSSGGADFGYYVTKQYCRQEGLPVICWQHGAEWHDQRMTQRNDLLNLVGCDRMLVYGEGVRKGYAASPLAQEEGCRIDCVGMPSLKPLQAIAPQRPRDRARILWPFGGYYLNYWYCGFSPPHSDRVYYREQMVILENLLKLLQEWPGLSVTIKLYEGSGDARQDPPWTEDATGRERVRLVRSRPNFVELLAEHDLVLIDSPTTTLLQAVATRLPVFTLMSVIRWPEEAICLLRHRACVAEKAAELTASLSQYLQGEQLFDVNHDEFLKQYGLGREDGERLAQSLVEMN